MKEVLFVIMSEYADWEAALAASALGNKEHKTGYIVKTVSLKKEPVKSIGGFTCIPDYGIDDVPDDFAALILVGGTAWRTPDAKKINVLVEKALAKNVPLGAICDATVFLGMNGFLNNVKHTSNTLESLKDAAGDSYTNESGYQMQQSVSDRGIITANGLAYVEFARDVLVALEAMPQSIIEEWYDYYKHGWYR